MSEIKTEKVKNKKKLSTSALILIIGIVIIAIPVIIFVAILGISALQTGSPRNGSRFNNDLDPAITSGDVSDLTDLIKGLDNVEDVEVKLSQGQLKVYIDTKDTCNGDDIDSLLQKAYATVNNKLSVVTYFTSTNDKRMYDLQINAYTTAEASDTREYKLLTKNGAQEQYSIQDMAHPKDPNIAAEVQGLTVEGDGQEVAEEFSDVDDSEQ